MLTIWSKVIQRLVQSNEESSFRLAVLLIDRPGNIFHWMRLSYYKDHRLPSLNLPLFIFKGPIITWFSLFNKVCGDPAHNKAYPQHSYQELRKSHKKLNSLKHLK